MSTNKRKTFCKVSGNPSYPGGFYGSDNGETAGSDIDIETGNIENIINDDSLTEFKTGLWYGANCAKNIKTYALNTKLPVFIIWSMSSCSYCKTFYNDILKSQETWDIVANTKAIFLFFLCNSMLYSHISKSLNDTMFLKYEYTGEDYCKDFFTVYEDGKYEVIGEEDILGVSMPYITGYKYTEDGNIKMIYGDINSKTYEVIKEVNPKRIKSPSRTAYKYSNMLGYIDWFNDVFGYSTSVIYEVTFYDYDRKTILKDTQKVEIYKDAIPPEDPYREGYLFTGYEPNYTNITSNLTCVALYSKIIYDTNPILETYCFGLKKDCDIIVKDNIVYKYNYKENILYKSTS